MRGCSGVAVVVILAAAVGCEINPDFDPPDTDGTATSGSPAIMVGNLRATWGTPNQIRWEWEPQGPPDRLLGYELVVGATEEDVLARSGSAMVWNDDQNPELGRFLLPNTGTEDTVIATVTDDHAEDTVYFAQLIATDTAGNVSESNIAAGRTTQAPIGQIVVFADDPPPGYRLPDTFVVSQTRPFAGSSHFAYEAQCEGAGQCWQNLRFQELGIDMAPLSEGSYATTAFLEFALSVDSSVTPWWCEIWMWYDGSSSEEISRYEAWTVRPTGQYYTVQIPLRVFQIGSSPVPYDATQTYGLFGFNVGCPWGDAATVLVDEVKIRW